jgi:hypothetical protein
VLALDTNVDGNDVQRLALERNFCQLEVRCVRAMRYKEEAEKTFVVFSKSLHDSLKFFLNCSVLANRE